MKRLLWTCLFLSIVSWSLVSCASHTAAPSSVASSDTPAKTTVAPTPEPTPIPPKVVVESTTFASEALGGKESTFLVVRPATLEPGRQYPVLYLLHGAYGSYVDWTEKTPLAEIHDGRDLLIVTPDGSQFGWYVDSPVQENANYETFITQDLIREVDSRYPTIQGRDGRGIAGLSMGGHGALSLAARHPDLFSSASSLSGILNVVNHPDKWHLNDAMGDFENHSEFWKEHSVYHLADRFIGADVALLFDTGVKDTQTGAIFDNRQVNEQLTNRAIVHTYREFPGTHSWEYWGQHVGEHIQFHLDNFAGRASGNPPKTGQQINGKWHEHYVNRCLVFEKENRERWSKPGASKTVVLLGSSSIEHSALYHDFSDYTVANRGISASGLGVGDYGILQRLYCSVYECNPRAVLILNGRNDLAGTARSGQPSLEKCVETYHEIVRRIRETCPDIPVFIVSCFPTSKKYENLTPFVKQFNEGLQKIAEAEGEKVIFIEAWSPFADEDGKLKEEFTGDGLHLNRKGHELFRPIVVEAFKAAGIEPDK